MVNLLFNCNTKPDQDHLSFIAKPEVIEVVLFEVFEGYSEEQVETAFASLNDIIKLYPGFLRRTTAKNGEGKYMDILYWTDMKSAKAAASDIMKNQNAAAIFNIIKPESMQMYHFNAFNNFEE